MRKIFILFVWCLGLSALGQENLIYQQIQNEKLNGEKFTPVHGAFKPDKLDPAVAKEFRNSKEVDFFQFDAKAISHKERSFSLDLPLHNQTITLELVAVDDSFYDYEVVTDKGKIISSNRSIKHYRGVVKDDSRSLVAISFFEDGIGGVISNKYGNFNIGTISKKGVIFYKDSNLIKESDWTCEEVELKEEKAIASIKDMTANTLNGKELLPNCVKIQLDVAYDVYTFNQYNFLRTESYMATLFNQVALLYQNEGIRIGISNIRIWTSPDPFATLDPASGGQLDSYRSYLSGNFSGNISMLFTKRTNGGIAYRTPYNSTLCRSKSWKVGVSGILGNVNLVPVFSRPVSVISHELGHIFGSHHTHACEWNGNNSAIDNCGTAYFDYYGELYSNTEGYNCYEANNPILPAQGGTIMSYCDQGFYGSPGVSFSEGFGPQPGNRMRAVVARSSNDWLSTCLKDCSINCMENIAVTSTVSNLIYDLKQASNTVTATNLIEPGGMAVYLGNSVLLKNGFKATEGAVFLGKVLPCAGNARATSVAVSFTEDQGTNEENQSIIQVYPNPTSDQVTVTSSQAIVFWELFNEIGQTSSSAKVNHQKEFKVNLSHLKKGLYLIRFTMEDGTSNSQKIMKK